MRAVHAARSHLVSPLAAAAVSAALALGGASSPGAPPARLDAAAIARNPVLLQTNRDGNREIYAMQANGSGLVNLTQSPFDDVSPAWSSSGTKIAFATNRDGNFEIYVMDADGSDPVRLTTDPWADLDPTWSPDGARIAFVSNRVDRQEDIYVMDADGSDQVRLTTATKPDLWPDWSPDGTSIVFASARGPGQAPASGRAAMPLPISPPLQTELFHMAPDGSGQAQLTSTPGSNQLPAWSANGSLIAFSSTRDGNQEIYLMNGDGTGQRRVTNAGASDWSPAWSPKGDRLVFASDRNLFVELFSVTVNGGGLVQLTLGGAASQPDWRFRATASLS
jgi:Tol biopolymer transport system component